MGRQYRYGAVYCHECGRTYYYKSVIDPDFADFELVECPDCGMRLEEIRAGRGYAILGSKPGDQGEFSCQLGDSDIDNVDQLIKARDRFLRG